MTKAATRVQLSLMKPVQHKKASRKDMIQQGRDLLEHNQQLSLFANNCMAAMKAAHKQACEGYDALAMSIIPSDRKNRKRFEAI
ncbi:MAG: hypothetical protein QGH15_20165, partial [Kiritimatiellia bacterium]|nr:hypothetical protein [Kiritimatiellia bacterium]